jgi:hypothetical protein
MCPPLFRGQPEGDVDGDGDIDLTDFGHLKGNMGTNWTRGPSRTCPAHDAKAAMSGPRGDHRSAA